MLLPLLATGALAAGGPPPGYFHMRFPTPLRWSRVLAGEVSSDVPARCEAEAGLVVGSRMLAGRFVRIGRCDSTWRPLRVAFTTGQRHKVLRAARREHRRPVLYVQVRTPDGEGGPGTHAGEFIIDVPGLGPRRDSPPGTTRISFGAAAVDGTGGQRIRGNVFIRTPLDWRRSTPDGALHATFGPLALGGACRGSVFADGRALASSRTALELVRAPRGSTLREGGDAAFAWRVRTTAFTKAPILAEGLRRVGANRWAGVRADVFLSGDCSSEAATGDQQLVTAVERIVRTMRLSVRLRH